jgi:hypothetical protein
MERAIEIAKKNKEHNTKSKMGNLEYNNNLIQKIKKYLNNDGLREIDIIINELLNKMEYKKCMKASFIMTYRDDMIEAVFGDEEYMPYDTCHKFEINDPSNPDIKIYRIDHARFRIHTNDIEIDLCDHFDQWIYINDKSEKGIKANKDIITQINFYKACIEVDPDIYNEINEIINQYIIDKFNTEPLKYIEVKIGNNGELINNEKIALIINIDLEKLSI